MPPAPVRILGVDTSLRSTGIAVIESDGVRNRALQYGTLRNPPKRSAPECLKHLYEGVMAFVRETKPTCCAIEGIFYCRNVRTAVILGQARGAVLAAVASAGLEVHEYSPRSVKLGVTGFGGAVKDQVGLMVKRLLNLAEVPQEDAADALAIAICHAHSMRMTALTRGKTPPA
ncbi:MAG: crossover junction endodeoxyribonuclease RuvC [Kiritimatiellia bacterium]